MTYILSELEKIGVRYERLGQINLKAEHFKICNLVVSCPIFTKLGHEPNEFSVIADFQKLKMML